VIATVICLALVGLVLAVVVVRQSNHIWQLRDELQCQHEEIEQLRVARRRPSRKAGIIAEARRGR
jgi:predicted Holliday junction resolvase-like endonuclease